jgi:hypothetical protein
MVIKEISHGCAGTAFVLATVGMEMVGASLSAAGGRFMPGFMVLVTIEEVTELASIALFLCAVLDLTGRLTGISHNAHPSVKTSRGWLNDR